MSQIEDALQKYWSEGYSLIPVKPGGKQPLVDWKPYQQKQAEWEQILRWWLEWPDANIGLITGAVSNVVAVDVDNGADPHAIFRDYPTSMVQSTPSGGWHLLYAYPGEHVSTRAGVAPHIDVRGDGGYIVVAPSVVNGKKYRWTMEGPPGSELPPIAVATSPAISSEPGSTDLPKNWISDILSGVDTGSRNQSATRLAGYLAKQQLPVDIAGGILGLWNRSLKESLPEHELQRTLKSVYDGDKTRHPGRQERSQTEQWYTSLQVYGRQHAFAGTQWVVEDWLPASTCALVVSPPGVYKTWLLTALAVAVARGGKFLGQYPVQSPGSVLFIQQEDPHQETTKRFATCIASDRPTLTDKGGDKFEAYAAPDLPIYIHPWRELHLTNTDSMSKLTEAVDKLRPKLVIIDPLYTIANTEDFMASAAGAMLPFKTMRDQYGCAFVIAHHTKKTAEGTKRQDAWGSQFLNAWLETGWQIRPGSGEDTAVIRRHFKVAGGEEEIGLRFRIGTAFNVEIITSEEAQEKHDRVKEVTELIARGSGPMTLMRIAKDLDMKENKSYLKKLLRKMTDEGKLTKNEEQGTWAAM